MAQLKQYFIRLLGTRSDWPKNMTDEEEKIMDRHFKYLTDLVAQKKVLMAGPCFNPVFGLIILQVESEEEAMELMKNEPTVVNGLHTYEMNPMRVALMAENKGS
jgi:uncharacterized protein YciI